MKHRAKRCSPLGVAAVSRASGRAVCSFRAFVIAPVEEREADHDAGVDRISDKTKKLRGVAGGRLRNSKTGSCAASHPIPWSPCRSIRNWLVEPRQKKTLSKPSVAPSSQVKKSKGKGDVFPDHFSRNQGRRGRLAKLCDFLYEFRKSGLLHRVATMDP